MDDNLLTEVRNWLTKAGRDLRSAARLMQVQEDGPLFDSAAYHCQQAAEKALKGYLAAREVEFPKIHNLSFLVELCSEHDDSFQALFERAEMLTPFATEFRYPGILLEPAEDDVKVAYQAARFILHFILNRLDLTDFTAGTESK